MKSAMQLNLYAHDTKIYGLYNATHTAPIDVLECAIGHVGFHTPPVELLKKQWNNFIATHGPDAKYLQVCHSGGADILKNALSSSTLSVRNRIIVLAIAPSVIIPKKLCFGSDNYGSERDFVTYLDAAGTLMHGNELKILKPHSNAKFWDHEFLSPTFEELLKYHIKDYIDNYGGKK